MKVIRHIWQDVGRLVKRFFRSERGVVMVEFALVLPMMLLVFAVMIESARMLWSYETVISGVHDATRYLARITPANICSVGGSVGGTATELMTMITQADTGSTIIPGGVSVTSVSPSYSCSADALRNAPVAIAQVTAAMTIQFPFAGIFAFFGSSLGTVNTSVTEQSRIYGS